MTGSNMAATGIAIRNYETSDQPWFESLNRSWIEQYFEMEAIDFQVLRNPEEHILKNGGTILMAIYDDQIVGTVALKYNGDCQYEFTKMAVADKYRGKKIGLALTNAALMKAREMNATKVILYSSSRLQPALSLYRKVGFYDVPVDGPYKRSDIKMEIILTNKMEKLEWFQRHFNFGFPAGMLPFFLERLQGTAPRLEAKLKVVPESVLSEKLDGKWSIKQNVGHLAEVDEIALKRISEIINGISPMSPAVFEPKHHYNSMNIDDVLKLFRKNRNENLLAYKKLRPGELQRSSLHPRLKVLMNPIDLAYFDAEHDDHHLVRINEILHYFNYE
jgi:ribosomal protein S18 acetylase RimI-like enzyme